MKQGALTGFVLLAIIQISSPLNVILALRIREARLTCEKIHGSDVMTHIRDELIKTKEFPNNEKYKCFMTCWMKELRQFKDGKLDVEEILRVTKDEIKDNVINLDKISIVIKACAKRVEEGDKPKTECDLVYRYVKCVSDETRKIGPAELTPKPVNQTV